MQRFGPPIDSAVGLILFGAGLGATSLLFRFEHAVPASILLAVVSAVSLYWVAGRCDVPAAWPIAAMLFPFTVGLLDSYFQFMPFFGDAMGYDESARLVKAALERGTLPGSEQFGSLAVQTYASILGVAYLVLGAETFVGIALNSWFWGMSVIAWLRIAEIVLDRSTITYAGPLFVVYPGAVLYASTTLRELPALCSLSVALWMWLRWLSDAEIRHALLGTGFLVPVILLRVELIPPVLIGIGIGWVYKNRANINRGRIIRLVLVGLIIGFILRVLDREISTPLNPLDTTNIEGARQRSAENLDGYLRGLEYDSVLDVFLYLPIRVPYFLSSPFPWVPGSYVQFTAAIDAAFVLFVSGATLYYVVRGTGRFTSQSVLLFGYAASVVMGYSLVVSRSGVAPRRRLYAIPVLIVFAGYGLLLIHRRLDPERTRPGLLMVTKRLPLI